MNAALANNLGNMLNRTLTLVQKNCGGQVRSKNLRRGAGLGSGGVGH